MSHILAGILLIAIGVLVIALRKPIVEYSIATQVTMFRLPFGKRAAGLGYTFAVIIGTTSIVAGLLSIFGILK